MVNQGLIYFAIVYGVDHQARFPRAPHSGDVAHSGRSYIPYLLAAWMMTNAHIVCCNHWRAGLRSQPAQCMRRLTVICLTPTELRAYCHDHGILVVAGPALGGPGFGQLGNPDTADHGINGASRIMTPRRYLHRPPEFPSLTPVKSTERDFDLREAQRDGCLGIIQCSEYLKFLSPRLLPT